MADDAVKQAGQVNLGTGQASSDPKAAAAADLAQLTAKPVPTLADEVEEFEEKQHDFQAMYDAGGKFKEQLEQISGGFGNVERGPGKIRERQIEEVEEIPTSPEVENKPELAGYVEKVEHEAELAGGVTQDYATRVLMGSANPAKSTVVLPLTEEQVQAGLHMKVWASIRWLAEWCVRQVKLLHGRVVYRGGKQEQPKS